MTACALEAEFVPVHHMISIRDRNLELCFSKIVSIYQEQTVIPNNVSEHTALAFQLSLTIYRFECWLSLYNF